MQASCDDRPDVQAGLDAQPDARRALGRLERPDARMQFERGANRPQVVVFVGDRHAEQRDDLFADRLIDEPSVLSHDVDRDVAQPRDQTLRVDRA